MSSILVHIVSQWTSSEDLMRMSNETASQKYLSFHPIRLPRIYFSFLMEWDNQKIPRSFNGFVNILLLDYIMQRYNAQEENRTKRRAFYRNVLFKLDHHVFELKKSKTSLRMYLYLNEDDASFWKTLLTDQKKEEKEEEKHFMLHPFVSCAPTQKFTKIEVYFANVVPSADVRSELQQAVLIRAFAFLSKHANKLKKKIVYV